VLTYIEIICSVEIPGPIDNQHLTEVLCGETSANQLVPSTDYAQLSSAMWHFLYAIYGGGPAVRLPLTTAHLS